MTKAQELNRLSDLIEEYNDHSNWYDQPPAKTVDDVPEALYRLEMVSDIIPLIKEKYSELKRLLTPAEKEVYDPLYQSFKISYIPLVSRWKAAMERYSNKTKTENPEQPKREERVKMPTISIPEFDGTFLSGLSTGTRSSL